jgi:hypothetical protein
VTHEKREQIPSSSFGELNQFGRQKEEERMSVTLIGQETFERVGKFLKVWKGELNEVIFARLVNGNL